MSYSTNRFCKRDNRPELVIPKSFQVQLEALQKERDALYETIENDAELASLVKPINEKIDNMIKLLK